MIKYILFLTMINLSFNLSGQDKLTYKQIDKLDRNSIIRLAQKQLNEYLVLLKDSTFDYSLIDTIKIYKNKTDFMVRFAQRIIFVPLNSNFYYGFDVNLLNDNISHILQLNNGSSEKPICFYHPTDQDLAKIKYIQKSLSSDLTNITIFEKETYFNLGYISSGEKLDKINGQTFDFWDEILKPDLDKTFVETKLK